MYNSTAAGTDPYTVIEGQILFNISTLMAGLAGGKPLIYFDESFSLLLKLVCQERTEHPKSVIQSGFPKIQSPGKGSQIEIFYAGGIVGIGYLPALLVRKVLSLICNMFLELSEFLSELDVILGPVLHTGQLALHPGDLLLGLTEPAGTAGRIALIVYIEVRGGVVQSDRRLLRREHFLGGVYDKFVE